LKHLFSADKDKMDGITQFLSGIDSTLNDLFLPAVSPHDIQNHRMFFVNRHSPRLPVGLRTRESYEIMSPSA
jgi:hypothetical protein